MPFYWKEYLKLAEFLGRWDGKEFTKEAANRTAVSRAYYSAFCTLRDYARGSEGFVPYDDGRDHSRLRRHFEYNGKKGISIDLDELRQWRNECDYVGEVGDTNRLRRRALSKARKLIGTIEG